MRNAQKLTDLQKGMIYQCQLTKDDSLYVTQIEIMINESLESNRIKQAWEATVMEVPLLRAMLHANDEFIFCEDLSLLSFEQHDLSQFTRTLHTYKRFKVADSQRGINLHAGLLHRLTLVKLAYGTYALLWTHHHVLFDAVSLMKIINLFLLKYLGMGSDNFLMEPPKNVLAKAKPSVDRAYWTKLLAGVMGSQKLNLGEGDESSSNEVTFNVSNKITTSMEKKASQLGVTLNTLLQAAWGIVQGQYENRKDITFGMVRAFSCQEVHDQIGLFINTLPVRINLTSDQTFLQYVTDIRCQHQRIRAQVATSLEEILQCSGLSRKDSLFDVAFDFKLQPLSGLLHDVITSQLNLKIRYVAKTHYQMMVEINKSEKGLWGRITYDASKHSLERVCQLAKTYEAVLTQISMSTDLTLGQLEVISPADKAIQLTTFNATDKVFNRQNYLHTGIERCADQMPNRCAVVSSRGNLNYQQLNIRANKIAHFLKEKGVVPNELIGIVMETGWEQVVAVLAILKAGAGYLPINADFPEARMHQLLKQGEVKIVLTQSHYLSTLNWPDNVNPVAVDDFKQWDDFSSNNLAPIQSPDDLAYVIFTSGSTGVPKGVMISHRAAVNTIQDINTRFGVTKNDTILGLSGLSFDLSVYDIFGVLSVGGKLVLPSASDRKDPGVWLSLVDKHQVTVWDSVPALVKMLAEYGLSKLNIQLAQAICQQIRLILMSGDWIPLDLPDNARTLCGANTEIISLGGATEASIWSILYPIQSVASDWRSIPYGKPMWNQTFHILDDNLNLKPIGVPGELFIGGAGVSNGYWKNSHKTKQCFLHHPEFGTIYRTGDMGRYKTDGNIEFMGRLDHQIKIRGYRVELGEIEFALREVAGIKDTIVCLHEPTKDNQLLVAYYVLKDETTCLETYLQKTLSAKLPNYMVPSFFIKLDRLPLSPNGKVDQKALPKPHVAIAVNKNNLKVAPQNDREEKILALWKLLFETEAIGVTDNFFNLGGHSLKALELSTRLGTELGLTIGIKDIFHNPTVKALSERCIQSVNRVDKDAKITVTQCDILPLSPAQERIWFLSKLIDDKPLYNITFCQETAGPLDADRLNLALHQLMLEQPALRTQLVKDNGAVLQRLNPEISVDLTVRLGDYSGEQLDALIKQQNDKLFELFSAPLFRVLLVRSKARSVLIVTLHHLIFDASSIDVFISELERFYCSGEGKAQSAINQCYAQFFNRLDQTEINHQDLDYWREVIGPKPAILHLPQMKKRPMFFSYRGKTIMHELPLAVVKSLRLFSVKTGITVSNVCLSALFLLLKCYGQKEAPCIGLPVTLRDHTLEQHTIGCFLNVLLVKANFNDAMTIIDVANQIQTQVLNAFGHNQLPYEALVNEYNIKHQTERNALFQVMFSYQQEGFHEQLFAGYKMSQRPVSYDIAKFDLTTFIFDYNPNRMAMAFEYCSDLFDDTLIETMMNDYLALLGLIISVPSQSIIDLTTLDGAQLFATDNITQCTQRVNIEDSKTPDSANQPQKGGFQTTYETMLAEIFSEILNVDHVRREDSFFALGGHSVLATKILLRVEEKFAIRMPLRVIFEAHTIADLAFAIENILSQKNANQTDEDKYQEGVL